MLLYNLSFLTICLRSIISPCLWTCPYIIIFMFAIFTGYCNSNSSHHVWVGWLILLSHLSCLTFYPRFITISWIWKCSYITTPLFALFSSHYNSNSFNLACIGWLNFILISFLFMLGLPLKHKDMICLSSIIFYTRHLIMQIN